MKNADRELATLRKERDGLGKQARMTKEALSKRIGELEKQLESATRQLENAGNELKKEEEEIAAMRQRATLSEQELHKALEEAEQS